MNLKEKLNTLEWDNIIEINNGQYAMPICE